MNRFRGRKKNKDEPSSRPEVEVESSGPFRMFSKKSHEEEPKKEIDLSSALPSKDEFRTSLLMTGLSARFSMLREQDDPKSKLGKANDDSVLFPKRQSRLMDFGAQLHDIAETESIKARPFARIDSYVSSDDAASTNGSIMHRAKPTEGNNLFGGRQKIYKIPAGSSSKGGGMGGRALYDDDVAQSAFQKWRQAEKERQSLEEEQTTDTVESETHLDFSRRRETSSTTSSAPSAARNSTAATSTTSSQPSSSVKESQSKSAAAAHLPTLERNVTRTRRLYEQGLTQDLQDQQSSALSRMDTLSRQRPLGSRTPDLTPPVPSPTSTGFGDRVFERRPIMGKASAPNLRSYSPSTTSSSQISPAEMSTAKFPRPEHKPGFGASPPLSPPISETEDHPILTIQPNDRGKATAMGVFSRPAQQYDESKYAQRQRQLQQARETPGSQVASESNAAAPAIRSRSASVQRTPLEKATPSVVVAEPAVQRESPNPTTFYDSDDASTDNRSSLPPITPQVTVERPDDQDHPAFRKSALPNPLALAGRAGAATIDRRLDVVQDSPTLGPNAGLSGMVRRHLRHDSTASSMSGITDQESTQGPTAVAENKGPTKPVSNPIPGGNAITAKDTIASNGEAPREHDEFARHLADGARRVRERLTTYVESDTERSTPTTPLLEQKKELNAPLPNGNNGLGTLRTKSSQGSLLDRENHEPGLSRPIKAQGTTGSSNAATSQSPLKPVANASGVVRKDSEHQGEEQNWDRGSISSGKDENVHAGLKAFRQAHRELQKMKELETKQRHQAAQKLAGPLEGPAAPQRVISHDGPPPAMLNRMPRDESRNSSRSGAGSRPGPRAASGRDRSGSEASTGGKAYSRVARSRDGSMTHEELWGHGGAGGLRRPSPGARPAGVPGTDIRQLPSHGSSPIAFPTGPDPSGRWMGRTRDVSDPNFGSSPALQGLNGRQDMQPYSRSRNGSLLAAAASTPNLHAAAAAAPPLPPINPRRKNGGFARPSEEGMLLGSAHGDVHGAAAMSEDEAGPDLYHRGLHRMASNAHGRVRHSPPRAAVRPPLPHAKMTSGNLPGGMI